ncbi:MAG: nickel-responsive transcriptional regulator NikR [Thermoplasmata archaeon]|nr:nickel-responsive transcriptional regulator NikR [Thermoplasmata archaeon]
MTSPITRTTVSLEPDLLSRLDHWVRRRNSRNRSAALRSIIRAELGRSTLGDPEADAVATVTLLYRHGARNLLQRLTAAEHRWGEHIRSSTHVHLHGGACLEVLVLTGKGREVVAAAEDLRGVRGIAVGEYVLSSPRLAGGTTGHHHPHGSASASATTSNARALGL